MVTYKLLFVVKSSSMVFRQQVNISRTLKFWSSWLSLRF